MLYTLTTYTPHIVILVIDLISICVTYPVIPTQSTTMSTTALTTTATAYIKQDFNITTTQTNVTCSQSDCHTTNRLDLAATVFLRILIIAACILVFVGMVKLSEVINRRCTCKKRQEIHFTRI